MPKISRAIWAPSIKEIEGHLFFFRVINYLVFLVSFYTPVIEISQHFQGPCPWSLHFMVPYQILRAIGPRLCLYFDPASQLLTSLNLLAVASCLPIFSDKSSWSFLSTVALSKLWDRSSRRASRAYKKQSQKLDLLWKFSFVTTGMCDLEPHLQLLAVNILYSTTYLPHVTTWHNKFNHRLACQCYENAALRVEIDVVPRLIFQIQEHQPSSCFPVLPVCVQPLPQLLLFPGLSDVMASPWRSSDDGICDDKQEESLC